MKPLYIILLLLCTGCSRIAGWEVLAATEICAERGGIDSLTEIAFINCVTCRDGHSAYIRSKE